MTDVAIESLDHQTIALIGDLSFSNVMAIFEQLKLYLHAHPSVCRFDLKQLLVRDSSCLACFVECARIRKTLIFIHCSKSIIQMAILTGLYDCLKIDAHMPLEGC